MNDEKQDVLFVLECGACDVDALRTIPSLAGTRVPHVLGLFIEDEQLYGAARLPGMKEVLLTSLETKSLSPTRIQQDLERQAQEMRYLFEQSARHLRLRHSFKVSRGHAPDLLAEAANNSELVVICRPLRAPGLRVRQGTQFKSLITRHDKVLFVNEPWTSGSRVVTVCDGAADQNLETLDQAEAIAAAEDLEFVIATTASEAQSSASDYPSGRIVRLTGLDETSLVELCQKEDARLLVIPAIKHLDWHMLLIGLLDRLSCSLLILNSARDSA